MRNKSFIFLILLGALLSGCLKTRKMPTKAGEERKTETTVAPLVISEVKVTPFTLSPVKAARARISFKISGKAELEVKVCGPDGEVVRTIPCEPTEEPGVMLSNWDGRDSSGRIVPNEAYYFVIRAEEAGKHLAEYNPASFSGGEEVPISNILYEKEYGYFEFPLERAARVRFRIGVKDGPLLGALADWESKCHFSVS